jgi:predicted Zn-dependent peptidase
MASTKAPAGAGRQQARVERTKLRNGLRVVLLPDPSAPVIGVAVYYDVGIRSEPEGRTGFAHLFEHLMFQGSASLGKMEHIRYVESSGGWVNGSTRLDYTNYYEALPAPALERALFLEADRMRAPAVTEENLANQIAVVEEEIRVNVHNQPYGGFPWLTLPAVLFDTFPNAHDGYGAFAELESATVDDARDFFAHYYAPGNAVLAVSGDLDPDETIALVERHFADIPRRRVPARPDYTEPAPTSERRQEQIDEHAPAPAVALGWRVPDPADLTAYLPVLALGGLLGSGDASRLARRLVQADRIATDAGSHVAFMENPLDVRDPTALIAEVRLPEGGDPDGAVRAVDEEIARVATDGVPADELRRVVARASAQLHQLADNVMERTLAAAAYEQQRGRAELVWEVPELLRAVTPEQVAAAAAALTPSTRARLDVVPGSRS